MTAIAATSPRTSAGWLFPITALASASLVFTVEPMIGRMALPLLGGSAGVWAASLVFFQAALLAGYVYAHALQRLPRPRDQVVVHLAVLVAAAFCLPLRLVAIPWAVPAQSPGLWLLAVLTVSVGAPFAALSATAPLIQVWATRAAADEGPAGKGPWSLYAASNLGSLAALLAYPTIVEPLAGLTRERLAWSAAYLGFILLIGAAGALVWRARDTAGSDAARAPPISWSERARWLALAAIPSSLLIGVTNAITADLGGAPFLWVVPLALYLGTFIIAFRGGEPLWPQAVLFGQALALIAVSDFMRPPPGAFLLGVTVHFTAFFLTALVCHQALVARRPPVARLTEFYFWLSLGGVIGGALSALAAPLLFRTVAEYPAALALSCLARPWGRERGNWLMPFLALAACAALMLAAVVINHPPTSLAPALTQFSKPVRYGAVIGLVLAAGLAALTLQARGPLFGVAIVVMILGAGQTLGRLDVVARWRDFYGTLHESLAVSPGLGGTVRKLSNGSTLHGAQAVSPAFRCQPIVYYASETPIGQVMVRKEQDAPALDVGVVGLGAGTMAAYERAADRFTFFEIDPLVVRIATDPRRFSYMTGCARGRTRIVLGDARLSLRSQPAGRFDILLVDAFSSDSVPSHLLTVEALRMYLGLLKPDGVVILHLSNRNLDLLRPAQAGGLAAGAVTLLQRRAANPFRPRLWEASEEAVLLARTPAGAAPFIADGRWRAADPQGVAPWTDDRIDLFGAFARRLSGR